MSDPNNLTLRLALPADLAAARRLFSAYPYKSAQAAAQRLDRERLVDFYAAGLKSALEKGAAPHWIVEDSGGKALALAGLGEDPWHSAVYGFKMGKVGPFLNVECGMRNAELGDAREATRGPGVLLIEAIYAAARERGIEHLSVRVDGEDFPNLHLFEAGGWQLVDVSLKFTRAMPVEDSATPISHSVFSIDLAGPDDHEWIRDLGSRTHGGTHFLNDPALPAEKTRALFAGWLDKCLGGLAYRVYVLRDGAGAGRGFVTYLRAGGFARAVGRTPLILDFVLLDPAVRGGGLGSWFIGETLKLESANGFDYCELRTSAHNLSAVITYEKLGFKCCASDFVLHKRF